MFVGVVCVCFLLVGGRQETRSPKGEYSPPDSVRGIIKVKENVNRVDNDLTKTDRGLEKIATAGNQTNIL